MKVKFTLFLLFSSLIFTSCQQKHGEVITKRIQYDVNIKSPGPNYDWWIQNLVGPQREKLVKMLLNGVKSGKYPAYDYYYHKLSVQDVDRILTDSIWHKIRRNSPPYNLFDTLIVEKININDIQKLRFMEEWSVNPKDFSFTKKVVGIAPVAKRIDMEGNIQWQPLFWIFPDKDFIKSLTQD